MAVGVGDILRVAVNFLWNNLDDVVNVWHILVDGMGTAADDSDVMDALENIFATWYGNLTSGFPNNLSGESLTGINVTEDELLPRGSFVYAGTSAGEGLPQTNAVMLQWHSATPRHGSRIYLPQLGEGGQNDGLIQAATITVLEDMAADVIAGFTDSVYGLTCHRVSYDRSAGIGRDLLTAFVPVDYRTQRRRRPGVGG